VSVFRETVCRPVSFNERRQSEIGRMFQIIHVAQIKCKSRKIIGNQSKNAVLALLLIGVSCKPVCRQ
jgi:hypothetical protein